MAKARMTMFAEEKNSDKAAIKKIIISFVAPKKTIFAEIFIIHIYFKLKHK